MGLASTLALWYNRIAEGQVAGVFFHAPDLVKRRSLSKNTHQKGGNLLCNAP